MTLITDTGIAPRDNRSVIPLSSPTMPPDVLQYIDQRIEFYRTSMLHNRRRFRLWKLAQMLAAGLIPVVSTIGAAFDLHKNHPGLTVSGLGILGFFVLACEAVQQIFQFQQLWNSYRVSFEMLDGERFLFNASADKYSSTDTAERLKAFAQRVESIISRGQAERSQIIRKLEDELKPSSSTAAAALPTSS